MKAYRKHNDNFYRNFDFNFNDNFLILRNKKEYIKKDGSNRWCKDNVIKEVFKEQNYTWFIQSIPFFNNFGGKASSIAKFKDTVAGYYPYQVITINMDATEKDIDDFYIIDLKPLLNRAGCREKEILENATDWNVFINNSEHRCIRFITYYNESAIYDFVQNTWVG